MVELESESVGGSSVSYPVRGALAAVLAVTANVLIVSGTRALGIAPEFQALSIPPVVFLSALGAVGATVVYWVLRRYTEHPDRIFVRVAAVVLVFSFLPDIALLSVDPNATVLGVIILMVMHVVVAVVSVGFVVYWNGGLRQE